MEHTVCDLDFKFYFLPDPVFCIYALFGHLFCIEKCIEVVSKNTVNSCVLVVVLVLLIQC